VRDLDSPGRAHDRELGAGEIAVPSELVQTIRRGSKGAPAPSVTGATWTITSSSSPASAN
jgi:hypothetical protein